MTETLTPALDAAMRAMSANPEDTPTRLRFHSELSRAELFVLLEEEVEGENMRPQVFDLSDGRAVLAFGSEMRLANFAGEAAAYAALPGRVLVSMLAQSPEGLALLIAPDTEHAALLAPQALAWLDETLAVAAPEHAEAVPQRIAKPELPAAVMALLQPALEAHLPGLPGLQDAILARADWQDGTRGHILALSGLPDTAHAPVARAVVEALSLSGLEAGSLDVLFPDEAALEAIRAVGLALAPAPYAPRDEQIISAETAGANPGLDPDRPPKLR
ncbi:SseB family protein [Pararhodobacter oceanensis]|uniref:SseB protein N-terminal domain-containing protein n=1 Tax=Pararhodobacter oceanensis TaxID=2172121 RepID=A0A2T8HSW8_9RHOB|nr:SseB family protein [Pararhodobacter oceanensis]PVH28550.1 hypothetical protein DDE20_10085 [Pararhodobacter oceanensis]